MVLDTLRTIWAAQHHHLPFKLVSANNIFFFTTKIRTSQGFFFFPTLFEEHNHGFDILVDAFRQNYSTIAYSIAACLKDPMRQPEQDIATFFCDFHTLAGRTYRDHLP